jgi:uncharacterized protein (TIGR02646 family)
MIQLPNTQLPAAALTELQEYQATIDAIAGYPARVVAAKTAFRAKNVATNATFKAVRITLSQMCSGAQRCCYCEDSAADEVEHMRPRHLYPECTFNWENYLYACGPCNGPKNNRFAIFEPGKQEITEIVRGKGKPINPPPPGDTVLIDPRHENPLDFFELDLLDTFQFVPAYGLNPRERERAVYTRRILRLNVRDLLVRARRTAYGSYVARLKEYVSEKGKGKSPSLLMLHIDGLKQMDHPTVWKEMQRQQTRIAALRSLFTTAPEALAW